MTEKKGQKFKVPDLKAKVRTLEVVFGEKFMRSELNPRTVDKWLREPDPTPYLTSLKKYFGVIGMKESDMIKGKEEFSEKVAEIYAQFKSEAQVPYGMEDVIAIRLLRRDARRLGVVGRLGLRRAAASLGRRGLFRFCHCRAFPCPMIRCVPNTHILASGGAVYTPLPCRFLKLRKTYVGAAWVQPLRRRACHVWPGPWPSSWPHARHRERPSWQPSRRPSRLASRRAPWHVPPRGGPAQAS